MVGTDVRRKPLQSVVGLDARDVAIKTFDELLSCVVLIHLCLLTPDTQRAQRPAPALGREP